MRHLVWCVVLLGGACGRKQPLPKEPATPAEIPAGESWFSFGRWESRPELEYLHELTWWQLHVIASGASIWTDVAVLLDADGRLQILEKDGWRCASLDDFSRLLERSKGDRYDEADGRRAPGISVGMGVQRRAAWLHVAWLLAVCMENKAYRTQIRVGARRLRLFLPSGAAIERTEPAPHARVAVELRADGFRLDGRKVSFDEIAQRLEEVVRAAENPERLVCAPAIADDAFVYKAVELFAGCLDKGIPRLDLDVRIPSEKDRGINVLRRPQTGR